MATKDFPLRTIVRDIAFCCHSKMEKKKKSLFWKGDNLFPNKPWINSKWRRKKPDHPSYSLENDFSLFFARTNALLHLFSFSSSLPHSFSRMFKVSFPRLINSKKMPLTVMGKREGVRVSVARGENWGPPLFIAGTSRPDTLGRFAQKYTLFLSTFFP